MNCLCIVSKKCTVAYAIAIERGVRSFAISTEETVYERTPIGGRSNIRSSIVDKAASYANSICRTSTANADTIAHYAVLYATA